MTKPLRCKTRRLIFGCTAALAASLLIALAIVTITGLRVHISPKPEFLGNTPRNIRRLEKSVDPHDFTFVVLGDTRWGTATFKALLDIASKDKPAFAVILGDFVNRPKPVRHELFNAIMAEQHLAFPVFLIPGNHDVHPDAPFTLEDFEQTYGPAQFYFTIGDRLFLFLNNSPPYDRTGQYLRFMREVLLEHRSKARDIFVFMHRPLSGLSPDVPGADLGQSQTFQQLAQEFGVRYVFAGDHHAYVKAQKNGTTYLITGGGGAHLRGQQGRFHHLLRMAVQDGTTQETVIAIDQQPNTLELLRRNIVVHLWPLMTGNTISVAVTLSLAAATIWVLVFSAGRLKRPEPKTARKRKAQIYSETIEIHAPTALIVRHRLPKESS